MNYCILHNEDMFINHANINENEIKFRLANQYKQNKLQKHGSNMYQNFNVLFI